MLKKQVSNTYHSIQINHKLFVHSVNFKSKLFKRPSKRKLQNSLLLDGTINSYPNVFHLPILTPCKVAKQDEQREHQL